MVACCIAVRVSQVQISAMPSFFYFLTFYFSTHVLEIRVIGLGLDLGLHFLEIFMENN